MLINQLLFEKGKDNLQMILGYEVTYIAQQQDQDLLLIELERMKM